MGYKRAVKQAQYDPEVRGIFAKLPTAISGEGLAQDSSCSDLLMSRFRILFSENFQQHIQKTINPAYHEGKPLLTRFAHLLLLAAETLKKHGNSSLETFIKELVECHAFIDRPHSVPDAEIVMSVSFAIVGWLTLLWKADEQSKGGLAVDSSQTPSLLVPSLPPVYINRSLYEVAYNLGDILPVLASEDQYRGLKVASLNIATLRRVGRLQTRWVDSFSSHLDLDLATNTIYLFRFPTQLTLSNATDSVVSRVLENHYDEARDPLRKFSIHKFAREVNLSYALLFRYDGTARKLYRSEECKKASMDGSLDPMLDDLCLGPHRYRSLRTHPVKDSFDAGSDFPILATRLLQIQSHIDAIQPNRISSLWLDQRDILRWYTFWAVIIVGGANLLIALVQVALGIAQCDIAKRALSAQLAASSPIISPPPS